MDVQVNEKGKKEKFTLSVSYCPNSKRMACRWKQEDMILLRRV
jgi:hypothetical protein